MTPLQHYIEAERLLELARAGEDAEECSLFIAEAQTHATLAAAGAAIISAPLGKEGSSGE